MDQVDKAIAKEEEKKKKESLKKDMKKVTDDIRSMKHELASLATQLAQLKSVSSGGANRRLVSAQKQKETKVGNSYINIGGRRLFNPFPNDTF